MSEGSWEERMAERAARRAAINAPTPGTRTTDDPARRAARPWLNGWPRIGSGTSVLIGTELHCVCCGRSQGITTVAFPEDWEPPGPDPVWPFGELDCPLCS